MRSRARLAALVVSAFAVLGLVTPAHAAGAPPAVPTLVGPASGATGVPAAAQLQVRATDPEGDPLQVTFHAQSHIDGAPSSGSPFTLMLMPDTQNYVSTTANTDIMRQQTQWIADNKDRLNIAFVAHLGDIVGVDTSAVQWQRASQYMAILDAAHIPNAVLPGNHDLDLTTGAAPLYQQYFPVSRYSGAAWNSPTASYGGYLGQNQFGPDAADRQNMDNYALFTAGGMDFLLLNLEFNPPDYALDWASRVLAAYPNRRAIIATHSYLDATGGLSTQVLRTDGGNSGRAMWDRLVRPSCSVFLVVNGHFYDTNTSEARRTDTNACGQPVQEMLSDYQGRPNGGNGWLRYLTFDPAADQIHAFTYSPYLGQSETDADSQFTVPYDMSAPVDLPTIGTASVASGGVASLASPAVPPGTLVDWYATVDDGTTTTRGPTWTYRTAVAVPTGLASDSFARTVSNGWGAADLGGTWTVAGGSTRFAVGSGTGSQTAVPGGTVTATLASVASTSTDLSTSVVLDRVPDAAVYMTISGRVVGSADYGARIKVLPGGAVQLHTERSGTVLSGGTLPGLTLATGDGLQVRTQVEGTNPTTIRVRAWKAGTAEPATWQYTATDSTAAVQAAGGLRLSTYASSTITGGALVARYDNVLATAIGTPPPANVPPTATFTATPGVLTVAVDSVASSDPDGTVVSRAWTFGDGGTSTAVAPTHPYAAGGTYTITLTVTDDDGATGTTSQQVVVPSSPPANQPPTASFTATPGELSVDVDSSASGDLDGTVVSQAWTFGDGGTSTDVATSHAYAAAGTYTVTLTVTDDGGATGTTSQQVVVPGPPPPNQPPTASFTAVPSALAVAVDSGASSDPDGTIVARAWSFGDGGTDTTVAPTHPYATAGTYTVSLTVTDDDGATGTTSQQVVVPGTPPPPTTLATDTFTRTVSGGWGTATQGGAWTLAGGNTRFSVNGSAAVAAPVLGGTLTATLGAVSATATDTTVTVGTDAVPTGPVYLVVSGRVVGTADYGARVKLMPGGVNQLHILRSGTALAGGNLPLTLGAGEQLRVRIQVQGTSPTVVRIKAWKLGTTEPTAWQYTVSDSTAGLQSAGGVRLQTYLSSAATALVAARWDDLVVAPIG